MPNSHRDKNPKNQLNFSKIEFLKNNFYQSTFSKIKFINDDNSTPQKN